MKIRCLPLAAALLAAHLVCAQSTAPALKWKFHTGGPVVGAPVLRHGLAYAGSADSTLYALDIETGQPRWTFRTGGPIRSAVCLDGDRLFLNGGDGLLYALDRQSGRLLWTFRSGGERIYPLYGYADYFQAAPLCQSGRVYFGSGDGMVYALDAAAGALVWSFRTGDVVHATPALNRDTLFVASFDGYLYALDARTGALAWRFKSVGHRYFPRGEMQGFPVTAGGLVFAGSRDYNLYAVDAGQGFCHWNKPFPKGWALALTPGDSTLYVGTSDDDLLLALDPLTGQERWRTDVQFNIFGPPALGDSLLYVGTLQGKLYSLDRHSGAIRWTFDTDGYRANSQRYFPGDTRVDKNDFYARVGTPEGYIEALNRLGAVFSTPALEGRLLVFGSADGGLYGLAL